LCVRYGCKASELMPNEQYPGAPRDPVGRLEYFRARNALIQAGNADRAVAAVRGRG
jgi:hypothetical protein